jgi:hypothetical protein
MRILFLLLSSFTFSVIASENKLVLTDEEIVQKALSSQPDQFLLLKEQLISLNLKDGVSYSEAEIIKNNFLYSEKATLVEDVTVVVDYGIYWKFGTYWGFSREKGKSVFINKKTGAVSKNGEVIYANPKEMKFVYPKSFTIK